MGTNRNITVIKNMHAPTTEIKVQLQFQKEFELFLCRVVAVLVVVLLLCQVHDRAMLVYCSG